MAGPAKSREAPVGIEKKVKPVEEAQASIDEWRARATDQDETRWGKWIEPVAPHKRVQRLGRLLSRNRDRELCAFPQAPPASLGNANVGRGLAPRHRQVHHSHAGIDK